MGLLVSDHSLRVSTARRPTRAMVKHNNLLPNGHFKKFWQLRVRTWFAQAGISPAVAQTIGIAIDHRRKNKSDKSLKANAARLKLYKSKLVLFPKKAKHPKAGDASADAVKAAGQLQGEVLPISQPKKRTTHRAIKPEERATGKTGLPKNGAYATAARARADARLVGVRAKKAAAEEEKKKQAS